MKKLVLWLLIALLAFAFCSCKKEEVPVLEPGEITANLEEPAKEKSKNELYEEMILNFGARKEEDGSIKINKTVSLYNLTEGFEDGTNLDEHSYFGWAMFYLNREYDYETCMELFTGAGENMGWAYPSEYYEPAVFKYFGVPAEKLRAGELYNAEKDYYNIGGGGGIGDIPFVITNSIDDNGETVVFHITIDSEMEGMEDYNMVLTVKLLPEGGYNYVSYLPEEQEEEPAEKVSAVFKIGTNGEKKELSAGDSIGEWVLKELSVNYDSNRKMNKVRAYFGGKAAFKGRIERNVLLEKAYNFIPDENELERMPSLVSEEFSEGPQWVYVLNFPDGFENKPNLDWEQTVDANVSIEGITLNYAFTMTADSFDVTGLKEDSFEVLPFYEDMLLNFGAEKRKDGRFYPFDGFCSVLTSSKGFADTKSITDEFYYNWYFSHMHKLGLSQEELEKTFASPFGENTGWAYPAEFFEPAAEKFFGVSAEELQKREFYYKEQDCYYIYTGPPGRGEIPEIVVNEIRNEDNIIFRLTIDYETQEDFDMVLTVKNLPEGEYNYLSYLPE